MNSNSSYEIEFASPALTFLYSLSQKEADSLINFLTSRLLLDPYRRSRRVPTGDGLQRITSYNNFRIAFEIQESRLIVKLIFRRKDGYGSWNELNPFHEN